MRAESDRDGGEDKVARPLLGRPGAPAVTDSITHSRCWTILLIGCWYSSSILAAKLNYILLKGLGSAIALSLFQQIFVSIAGTVVLLMIAPKPGAPGRQQVSSKYVFRQHLLAVAPLALGLTCMSVSYNSAMDYIPVSFLNTIKSTIPLWTALVCWLFYKKSFSILTKLSLLPIVGGVGLASATEIGFHPFGFALGVFSAFNQTYFNMRAKLVLIEDIMTPMQLQSFTSAVSAIFLGLIYVADMALAGSTGVQSIGDVVIHKNNPGALLFLGGLNYFAELRLSYASIGILGPLGYSIADIFRRLVIIVSAVILFGNPIQLLNIIGICIAMIGILIYTLSVAPSLNTSIVPASKKKLEPPIDEKPAPMIASYDV